MVALKSLRGRVRTSAALALLLFVIGSASVPAKAPLPLAAVLMGAPNLAHLAPLVADPGTRERLLGPMTLLAPIGGSWGLPRDAAALAVFLDLHSLAQVWTIEALRAAAKADPSGQAFVGRLSVVLHSDGGLMVVDPDGNTARVLSEEAALGGSVLVIDRPLGGVGSPIARPVGGAFVRLP